MEKQKEVVSRDVYVTDLFDSVKDISDKSLEVSMWNAGVCCTCFNRKDSVCNCVRNKQIRDGKKMTVMSSMLISLNEAEDIVSDIAKKVIEDLKAFWAKQEKKIREGKLHRSKQKNINSNN